SLGKRWSQKTARADFRLDSPNCFLEGDVTFFQSASEFTRYTGQINQGFDWSDPNEYLFEIYDTAGIYVMTLHPNFSVNAPPGGSSSFQDDLTNIALEGVENFPNVLGYYLSIFHLPGNDLLCSAQINPAP
ncbi:12505_t:CDS:1, partial [Ambispora gerdemannii]